MPESTMDLPGIDLAAFVRAVVAAGDDALPRLVAADWIDERGDGVLAAALRLTPTAAEYPQFSAAADLPRRHVLAHGAAVNSAGVIVTPTTLYRLGPGGLERSAP